MQNNFPHSLALVLKSEGGFQMEATDHGNKLSDGRQGSTNLGVTQANWEAFVGHPVSTQDMKDLTPEGISSFYKRKYWDAVRGDDLPSPIDYMVFDFAVNAGPGRAIKLLQVAVDAVPDGHIGFNTLAAINATPVKELINKFSEQKESFYKRLNNPTYENGWLNRVTQVEANANSMVA